MCGILNLQSYLELQWPDPAALQKVVQPLVDALTKAHGLTEGKRTEAFNHQKAVAESLLALSWVCYAGKDCGTELELFALFIGGLHSRTLDLHSSVALVDNLLNPA